MTKPATKNRRPKKYAKVKKPVVITETHARLVEEMMRVATVYARWSGRKLSTISREAVTMSDYFVKIHGAKGSTVATYGLMMQWFSNNWPDYEQVPWPVGVPRPFPVRVDPIDAGSNGDGGGDGMGGGSGPGSVRSSGEGV